MPDHQVTVCIKVTVPDVEAVDQTEADQLVKEDVLHRFPINWVVEEIQEPT